MKIVIGHAGDKKVSFDLDTLIVSRLLIQANSGAGKSYLLRKLMEELFGHVQVIAIDPEGEFATLREKFDYVLVGKGGETPVHVSTAAEVAHKLLELRASAVCDLYETPARERHTWVKAFLDALINAPKKLWHPLVIIVDEAHLFCPEKGAGESEASDAMIDLATRGRKRGFCAVFATQRLGKLRKDAAAELQNVLVGGTFLDIDIKRAAETLGIPKGAEERTFAAHMKMVQPGTFVALGRAVSKERLEFHVDDVITSHPKSGSAKHGAEPPPPSEKIRGLLPQLADLPKVAEEKARTIDDFKRQVRLLSLELTQLKRAQPKAAAAVPPAKVADPRAIEKAIQKRDQQWARSVRNYQFDMAKGITGMVNQLINGDDSTLQFQPPAEVSIKVDSPNPTPRHVAAFVAQAPGAHKLVDELHKFPGNPGPRPKPLSNENSGITPAQMKILAALAEMASFDRGEVSKKIIAVLAGVSSSSSSYTNNLGALRTKGLIDYPNGGTVCLTAAGHGEAPKIDPPASPEEMRERCKAICTPAQARILDALSEHYPSAIAKSELASLVDASAASSSFTNNLGFLRSAGMIDYPAQGTAKLEPWVMLEE